MPSIWLLAPTRERKTFIAGIIRPEAIYISADHRRHDNVTKVYPVERTGGKYVFAADGEDGLPGRLQVATFLLFMKIKKGNDSPITSPDDFLYRVIENLMEERSVNQTGTYKGVIMVGGYDNSGNPQLCFASLSNDIETGRQDKEDCPVYLWPSGIDTNDTWDEKSRNKADELWGATNGDTDAFLREMSKWVAEEDPSQSCGDEVVVVRIDRQAA